MLISYLWKVIFYYLHPISNSLGFGDNCPTKDTLFNEMCGSLVGCFNSQ